MSGASFKRSPEDGRRFLLWIDAVGGFLVCLGQEITIGQPNPHYDIEVPIWGDLSSRHAIIRRDGEGYLIKSGRPLTVDGRDVHDGTNLYDGCVIELTGGVKLRFRQPHALSSSARLEPISDHRTQPTTDAVLLMAESLVLGPLNSSHVECPHWANELVLFRRGNELFCRCQSPVEVDGRPATGETKITFDSKISGEDFSLSLEAM